MAKWFSDIEAALEANDKRGRVFTADHGRLLISPHGARIVGCELEGVAGNLFWHGPGMTGADTARTALATGGAAIGGDRLWVAPEVAFMWPDLAVARKDPLGTYDLPPQMDPGQWMVDADPPGHVRLSARMKLTDHRTDRNCSLALTRQISLIDPPANLPKSIKSISFAIENGMTILEADDRAVFGLWDLLQLPATGTLICPTTARVDAPRSYYDPFGRRHVQCGERCVRFLIDGQRRIKMGLPPGVVTGRMAYYRRIDKTAVLVFRGFLPQPGQPYVDVPRDSDETFGGDAIQAYNDDAGPHSFGEMEYHNPALVGGRYPSSRTGCNVTHVLAGPDAAIRDCGATLLGVPIEPIA